MPLVTPEIVMEEMTWPLPGGRPMIAQADSQILLHTLVHEIHETPVNICEFNPSPPASLIDQSHRLFNQSQESSLRL